MTRLLFAVALGLGAFASDASAQPRYARPYGPGGGGQFNQRPIVIRPVIQVVQPRYQVAPPVYPQLAVAPQYAPQYAPQPHVAYAPPTQVVPAGGFQGVDQAQYDFIRSMYTQHLRREPDQQDLQVWGSRLAQTNNDTHAVLDEFLRSIPRPYGY